MAGAKSYRNIGTHPIELVVGDTVPTIGPGDFIDMTDEDAKSNQGHIDDGVLVDVQQYSDDLNAAETEAAQLAQAEEEKKAQATATTTETKTEEKAATKGGK